MRFETKRGGVVHSILDSGRGKSGRRAALLAATAVAVFLAGALAGESVVTSLRGIRRLIRERAVAFRAGMRSQPERLELSIEPRHFAVLAQKRREALSVGVLVKDPQDWVPALLRHRDKTLKVLLRLKGDWTEHLRGDKWSFRIELADGESLFGMRELSLQHPSMRNWAHEWLYHEALKSEGLLTTRYDFVAVTINGQDKGVYAIEEHFGAPLLSAAGRSAGPILKYSEDLLWDERSRMFPKFEPSPAGLQHEAISVVEGFGMKRILRDPVLAEQFRKAAALLEGFRSGKISPQAAFDIEKLAGFFAVSELMGARHATIWHNLRFYYDPVRGLLEPIGFDGDAGKPLGTAWSFSDGGVINGRLFAHRDFMRAYVRAIERVSAPKYLRDFFVKTKPALRRRLDILSSEYPEIRFSSKVYRENRAALAVAVNPPRAVNAFLREARGGRLILEIANIQPLAVELLGVSHLGRPLFPVQEPTILPGLGADAAVEYKTVRFSIPKGHAFDRGTLPELLLGYRILGAGERSTGVFPWAYPDAEFRDGRLTRRNPNDRRARFLARDERAKSIRFLPGNWTLEEDLVLPAGYTVYLEEGTRIEMRKGARLISYSPVRITGSDEAPVVVSSADGSGGGVWVLAAAGRSLIERARFEGLAEPVTFYESPVDVVDSEFLGSRGLSALRMVRSPFMLERSLFARSSRDAFAADFSRGEIRDSFFAFSGADALAFIGSAIKLSGSEVLRAGGRGLSAGEMSRVLGDGFVVSDVKSGLVSRDISVIELGTLSIDGAAVGLAAYQEKPAFGPGSIRVGEISMERVGVPYKADSGSRLVVAGKE